VPNKEQSKMKSDNLEHDLKMDIIDLKMKISELTAENEQEKKIKMRVWQDCRALTSKCQQLEKILGNLREKNAILKHANDDLLDSKNEQYKSTVAENKYLKDKTGGLETSLETANQDVAKLKERVARLEDANAKLDDRNAQLRMGMLTNEFHPMSRFGHTQHMNTDYMEDYNELQVQKRKNIYKKKRCLDINLYFIL
jgi:predicted nuclease with TOPRIM domain